MAKRGKKNKKNISEISEAIQETVDGLKATGVIDSEDRSPVVNTNPQKTSRRKNVLNTSESSVEPVAPVAQTSNSTKRLFPTSLLSELNDIQDRLKKLEDALAKKP